MYFLIYGELMTEKTMDEKIKIWQVNWTELVELLKRRLIKELPIIDVINSVISLKWYCQTLTPEYFDHLNTCLFSKLDRLQ